VVGEVVEEVHPRLGAPAATGGVHGAGDDALGRCLDLGQAGVDADGLGPGQAQLDAVVLGRVVGCG